MGAAHDILPDHITPAMIRNGQVCMYYVKSSRCGQEYLVVINDESYQGCNLDRSGCTRTKLHQQNTLLPYCDCPDWKKYQVLCKHILAIMMKENLVWDNLPLKYRESTYFNLDEYITGTLKPPTSCNDGDGEQHEEIQAPVDNGDITIEHQEDNQEVVLGTLQKPVFPKRTLASACRGLLNEIKSLTYLARDDEALEVLHKQLHHALESFKKEVPTEAGLLLEQPKTVKAEKDKRKGMKPEFVFDQMPQAKKRKSKFTGRVGRGNEKARFYSSITVDEHKTNSKHAVKKEVINLDDKKAVEILNKLSDDHPVKQEQEETVSDVTITKVVENSDAPKKTSRKLKFSLAEKEVIMSNGMLTDESINLSQQLLKKVNPSIAGLYDTSLGRTNSFEIVPSEKNYIQILHTGHTHWICVANTKPGKESNDTCYVYDSLNGGSLSKLSSNQIAEFSHEPSMAIKINIRPVQQQTNGVECGLYAIAFATSLAFGENPEKIIYDEKNMRKHLVKCLTNEKMEPFPTCDWLRRIARCRSSVFVMSLYCACRRPYFKPASRDEDMAQCSSCRQWYHRACDGIRNKVFHSKSVVYKCKGCK